ncbi:hypothetical protein EV183_002838 [Coemansia sp. RSA 2336]|nr:hypothetical protein EV183_002838 [Coemansia sp. RSA 2336]
MSTCMQQLGQVDNETHQRQVVEVATRVLYLRTTTQIDELMNYASTAIHQRWDFLGPSTGPHAELFQQIDNALQWTSDSSIGDYIRHAHFALELTEDQAEIINNVRFRFMDRDTAYATVPFALFAEQNKAYVLELVWEDLQWKYADAHAVEGTLPGHTTVAEAIKAAEFPEPASGSDDDDYWGQYSDDEGKSTTSNGPPQPAAPPVTNANHLMTSSLHHSLAAAAAAAKAIGIDKDEFLELASKVY